jgi:hypothetical protein
VHRGHGPPDTTDDKHPEGFEAESMFIAAESGREIEGSNPNLSEKRVIHHHQLA